MALLQPNLDPSEKDLRWFAGLWFPAFAAMVGYLVFRKLGAVNLAIAIWTAAAVISLAGLWSPRSIRAVYQGMMRLTFPIGWTVSHILLFVVYFAVIMPIGIIIRLFDDPMQRRFEPGAKSYWIAREQADKAQYLRQI